MALVPGDFSLHTAPPETKAEWNTVTAYDGQEHHDRSWSPVVLPDTISAGQTFITNLPDSVRGQVVKQFTGIKLPARSWLINRAFFWRTVKADRGTHNIWFRATMMDESVDSVSVAVVVR